MQGRRVTYFNGALVRDEMSMRMSRLLTAPTLLPT